MYEDYMQNLLGYQVNPYQNSYDDYNRYPNQFQYGVEEQNYFQRNYNSMQANELEDCYPEIYKVVYPMVRKACQRNTMPINLDVVNNMVNEIAANIEPDNSINLNINIENEMRNSSGKHQEGAASEENESRANCPNCNRQRNPLLNDIIRILIIRELLGGSGGMRPPMPPFRPGMRPPMPRYY